jgi:hypothetical protein
MGRVTLLVTVDDRTHRWLLAAHYLRRAEETEMEGAPETRLMEWIPPDVDEAVYKALLQAAAGAPADPPLVAYSSTYTATAPEDFHP